MVSLSLSRSLLDQACKRAAAAERVRVHVCVSFTWRPDLRSAEHQAGVNGVCPVGAGLLARASVPSRAAQSKAKALLELSVGPPTLKSPLGCLVGSSGTARLEAHPEFVYLTSRLEDRGRVRAHPCT